MCLPITTRAYIWERHTVWLSFSLSLSLIECQWMIHLHSSRTEPLLPLPFRSSSSFFHHFYLSNWLLRVWWFFHANFPHSLVVPSEMLKSAHLSMRKVQWRGEREWKKREKESAHLFALAISTKLSLSLSLFILFILFFPLTTNNASFTWTRFYTGSQINPFNVMNNSLPKRRVV